MDKYIIARFKVGTEPETIAAELNCRVELVFDVLVREGLLDH